MNEPNGSQADTPDTAPVDTDSRGPVDVEGTRGSVLAVLVTRNGAGFLERTITALAKSTRHPDRLVAVDTGSDDETSEWLEANGSPVEQVIAVAADMGFAAAVHEGVDTGGAGDYVWLLHDDSAPDPTALENLCRVLDEQPSVGVVGPKVLGWDEPRRLLEVGVSISRSGRRYTGLEAREQDQGQLDNERDVLAVGSAGMLVRREVWDELGGFDRAIRLFREDVDLGWRANLAGHRVVVTPQAVVHHAEAVTHHRRDVTVSGGIHADRASSLYVLLANTSRLGLVPRWLWLVLVSSLRALGFLLGKAPHEASAELAAMSQVLFRPGILRRGRRARRRHRIVPARTLRSLFPPPGHQVRQSLETAVAALNLDTETPTASVLESGPSDEDLDSFVGRGSGRIRRWVRRPGVILFTFVLFMMALAWRGLYRGGVLHGGGLLPLPQGASDVWSDYLASWHPVTAGSPVAASPAAAVMALLGTLLLGKATWVVPVLMVIGPAVAAAVVYVVLSTFGLTARIRVWAALAYAMNPVLLSAIAQGRWGVTVVAVLLPLLALTVARACGLRGDHPSGQAAALAALLFSVIVAVNPSLWPPMALLGLVVGWRLAPTLWVRLRLVGVVFTPLLVWLAWLPTLVKDPSLLLLDPGVPLPFDDAPPWHVLLLDAGGWTSAPLLFGLGLVVAGIAAASRAHLVPAVRGALLVAGVGLLWALVIDSISLTPNYSAVPVAPWAGAPLQLAVAGLIAAAAVAARGGQQRLQRRALSWRQPVLAVVLVMSLLTPVLCTLWWFDRGAQGPIDRGIANPLPAFVRAQSDQPEQIRTLVLRPSGGRLEYTLLRQRDSQFGDVETSPDAARLSDLSGVVSDLASGRGSAPVERLSDYAVAYVLAVPPVDPELETALDSAPGVLRIANPGLSSLWRIENPTGRVRVVSADGQTKVLPSSQVDTTVTLPAGEAGRVLALAELADSGWSATSSGTSLKKTGVDSWSEGFALADASGSVRIENQNRWRQVMYVIELVAVLALVVLALPSRRSEPEELV